MKLIFDYIIVLIISVVFILAYLFFIPKSVINNILMISFFVIDALFLYLITKSYLNIKNIFKNNTNLTQNDIKETKNLDI